MRKLPVLLTGTVARGVLALGMVLALLVTVVDAHAASRGISVELKETEAPGAPSIGTIQLYSKSYALVIGNNQYRNRAWGRLSKAVSDARRIAVALEKRGFDVTLKTDLSSGQLRKAFKDFFIKKGRDKDARLFVWYAGHGATVDGEGYLIPTDGAAPDDKVAFLDSAVSLRDFSTFVRYADSKHVYTVFDSCFAGTIFNVARSRTPPAITRVTTEPVRQFLSSGDAGQLVSDDGIFATLFLEALGGRSRADTNTDGYLTASEIGAHVTYRLSNSTNNRQTPRSGKLRDTKFDKGDFVFKLASVEPARRVVDSNAEIVFWQSVQNSTNPDMYEEYLRQYPKGKFAGLARLKIKELKGQETASLTPPTLEIVPLDETHVVIKKSANVRSDPDVKSKKVTTLGRDTGVQVTGKTTDGKWFRIAHNGTDAFVWNALIKPVDPRELAAWSKIKNSRERAEFEGFLSDHPSGRYATNAQRLLAALRPVPKTARDLSTKIRPKKLFQDKSGKDKILVIAARQKVPTMDPSIKYDASIRTMQNGIYDALAKYVGSPPKVVPWLASKWDVSADNKTYTFHLVKNAKFHNGDPVTAEAIRWSYARTLKLGKGPAWMLHAFLKAENIRVVDDHTVSMTLDRAYGPFISFVPWWYIMNPKTVMANEVYGDMGQKWMIENEAGSGPYKLKRNQPGTLIELERVQDYWRGHKGVLGGILYRTIRESSAQRAALVKGEADIVTGLTADDFEQVSKMKGMVTSTQPALTAFGLKYNTKAEYTSDVNVRKAIAYAYDYDAFVKIFNGRAKLQTSPFADDIKGKINVPGMPRKDMAKAKAFLAKSKWPNGGFEIEYVYVQGFEVERQMGLVLIDALRPLNITVKMVPLTWSNMVARGSKVETSPHLMAIFATPVSTDPDAVAIQYHPSSWGRYYGTHYYDNKEVHALIEKARSLSSWEERKPLYEEIQKRLVADQPEIFGMMRKRMIVYRDWVKGFEYSPVRITAEVDLYPLYISK